MNRDFKGVWIPKDIWEEKNLTWMEKLFLVEIDSLDNDRGCYASNKYFAEFFNLSNSRCSQIISSLEKKGLININLIYKKDSKVIQERQIKVFNKLKGGIKYSKGGYLENYQDNNTYINNTNNNMVEPEHFEFFWQNYPKKVGKQECKKIWIKQKLDAQIDAIINNLNLRKKHQSAWKNKEMRYILNPKTYLGNARWEDEIAREKRTVEDIHNELLGKTTNEESFLCITKKQ